MSYHVDENRNNSEFCDKLSETKLIQWEIPGKAWASFYRAFFLKYVETAVNNLGLVVVVDTQLILMKQEKSHSLSGLPIALSGTISCVWLQKIVLQFHSQTHIRAYGQYWRFLSYTHCDISGGVKFVPTKRDMKHCITQREEQDNQKTRCYDRITNKLHLQTYKLRKTKDCDQHSWCRVAEKCHRKNAIKKSVVWLRVTPKTSSLDLIFRWMIQQIVLTSLFLIHSTVATLLSYSHKQV